MLGMPKNKSTEGLEKLVSDWMNQLGDRIGTERMLDAVSGAMAGVTATRKTVDRNLSALLSMANIPSRGEYQRMQERLNHIQNSIRNLSRRLDDLNRQIAEEAAPMQAAKAAKPKTAAKTTKPKAAAKAAKPKTAAKTTKPKAAAKSTKPKAAAKPTKPKTAAKTTKPKAAAKATKPKAAAKPTKPKAAAKTTKPKAAAKAAKPKPANSAASADGEIKMANAARISSIAASAAAVQVRAAKSKPRRGRRA